MRNFENEFQTINTVDQVRADCNSITFINTGTSVAQVNGINLKPAIVAGQNGEQLVSEGNEGEIDKTLYRISFSGAGSNVVQIIRKVYK